MPLSFRRKAALAGVAVVTACAVAVVTVAALPDDAGPRPARAATPSPGDRTRTLKVNGRTGDYLVHVPEGRGSKGLPLVIATHGMGGNAAQFSRSLGLNALADAQGFVAVYPDGYEGRKSRKGGDLDVAFLDRLIDDVVDEYKVDPEQVFAAGASRGGVGTFQAACRLGDKIAGIATVVAQHTTTMKDMCAQAKSVPVLMINGTADPIVPFDGGANNGKTEARMLSARDTFDFWQQRNGCTGPTVTSQLPDTDSDDGSTVTRSTAGQCTGDNDTVLYTVKGGGHTWPGATAGLPARVLGATNRDINATQVIWDFFAAHRTRHTGR
ncbi:hypothetical protein I5Q34_04100 [Streptomyces sp. AV19]|uniref:alpha/beta hydrolase family esterase n=1 Tax=Streptomyces sp. AV19 TaxID=2793068 RepID=UPI0018FE6F06|nr:PHB depolymerase family esterase [Streptomyces sp. AV19]MBH1933477.1 hypothetical protein [Streptomyces sp. AV19]MDG4532126.1 hypothetical protein [Streptomyces sp. AV19]